MRTFYKYFLITVLAFTVSACSDDFLEYVPQDQATIDGWYRNEEEVRQSTATLYARAWWGFTDQLQWLVGDLLAGDIVYNYDEEGQYFFVSYNSSNRHLVGGWRGLYDVVTNANLIIDNLPAIASGYGVSEEAINAAVGEARFFRGSVYYLLAEYWGDVPILENPAEKVGNQQIFLPRNRVEDVYEFIRRDLVYAAENLPSSDDPGRVTSWAAKGMLAKLHVTLGQRYKNDADFTTAADYAADVINNSGLSLAGSYEDLFTVQNEHDPEVLWAIECINNGWGFGSSRMTRWGRHPESTGGDAWGGGISMTLNYTQNLETNAEGQTDLRRRAIYMTQGDYYDYLATEDGGYTYEIVFRDAENNVLNGPTDLLNNLKKHVVGNGPDIDGALVSNQDSPFNIYMLRLADVYLLYAEAMLGNQASLSAGPGYQAYLDVRSRAGLNPPTDGNMTYVDLFNERRVELGLEAQSWLDVKRRYYRDNAEALNYLNTQARGVRYISLDEGGQETNDMADYELVYSPNDLSNPPCAEGDSPDCIPGVDERKLTATRGDTHDISVGAFSASNMSLPIPLDEITANPLLAEEAVPYFE